MELDISEIWYSENRENLCVALRNERILVVAHSLAILQWFPRICLIFSVECFSAGLGLREKDLFVERHVRAKDADEFPFDTEIGADVFIKY